ncbi:1132_t:CDS:1, partial [Racocetra fulgida]
QELDNKKRISHKKEELYSLIEHVKSIIEENSQQPNAKQWINASDKNFNSLRRMVDNCEKYNKRQKIQNTWRGQNHNTF